VNDVADIAVEVSRLIHDQCKDVPHDIGLQVLQVICDRYHFHLSSGGQPDTPRYTRLDVSALVGLALAVQKLHPRTGSAHE